MEGAWRSCRCFRGVFPMELRRLIRRWAAAGLLAGLCIQGPLAWQASAAVPPPGSPPGAPDRLPSVPNTAPPTELPPTLISDGLQPARPRAEQAPAATLPPVSQPAAQPPASEPAPPTSLPPPP